MMPGLVGLAPDVVAVPARRAASTRATSRRRSPRTLTPAQRRRHARPHREARPAHDPRASVRDVRLQRPGARPLIRVAQNATITVRFHNRIDLPSTVHWHGVRLDNRFDGGSGVTQEPVAARRRLRLHRPLSRTPASTGITRTCARTSSRRWASSATCSSTRRTPDYYSPVNREQSLVLERSAHEGGHADSVRQGGAGLRAHGTCRERAARERRAAATRSARNAGEVVRFFSRTSPARARSTSRSAARRSRSWPPT